MKEFELGLGASTEELDILDDEHPNRSAIAALPILRVAQSHRRDELTRKLFRRRIDDSGGGLAWSAGRESLGVLSVMLPVAARFSGGRPREMGLAHAGLSAEVELVEAALASARNRLVIPHGSSVYSYHFSIASDATPFSEFLMMAPDADRVVPMFDPLFVNEPVPVDGHIELGCDAGFGVDLNPALRWRRPYTTDA